MLRPWLKLASWLAVECLVAKLAVETADLLEQRLSILALRFVFVVVRSSFGEGGSKCFLLWWLRAELTIFAATAVAASKLSALNGVYLVAFVLCFDQAGDIVDVVDG